MNCESISPKSLTSFSTKELVEELQKREGVDTSFAKPYEDVSVSVNGPAILLVVTD